jgi:hypothetical protein
MARKRETSNKPGNWLGKAQNLIPKGYDQLLGQIKDRIRTAQLRAAVAVNRELIELYWQIGQSIVDRQRSDGWGKSVVERLALDLKAEFPGMTGFSPPKCLANARLLPGVYRRGPKTATTRGRIGRSESATGRGRNPLGGITPICWTRLRARSSACGTPVPRLKKAGAAR